MMNLVEHGNECAMISGGRHVDKEVIQHTPTILVIEFARAADRNKVEDELSRDKDEKSRTVK